MWVVELDAPGHTLEQRRPVVYIGVIVVLVAVVVVVVLATSEHGYLY